MTIVVTADSHPALYYAFQVRGYEREQDVQHPIYLPEADPFSEEEEPNRYTEGLISMIERELKTLGDSVGWGYVEDLASFETHPDNLELLTKQSAMLAKARQLIDAYDQTSWLDKYGWGYIDSLTAQIDKMGVVASKAAQQMGKAALYGALYGNAPDKPKPKPKVYDKTHGTKYKKGQNSAKQWEGSSTPWKGKKPK